MCEATLAMTSCSAAEALVPTNTMDYDAPCRRCGVAFWEPGNEMLLCDGDGCDKAFHMLCLPYPLASVPEGEWLCPTCDPGSARPAAVLSVPVEVAKSLIAQNRRAMDLPPAYAHTPAAGESRPLQTLAPAADDAEEAADDDAVCEACARTLCSASNEMLLCDGEGCKKAYHMLCLPRPLASVPPGEWLCPSCEVIGPVAGWSPAQELTMPLAVGERLWARDIRGLWGKARVVRAEEPGNPRRAVGITFAGFAKKYDETIDLGTGRLRPLDLGPPVERPSQPLRPDHDEGGNIYIVDRVLEARAVPPPACAVAERRSRAP